MLRRNRRTAAAWLLATTFSGLLLTAPAFAASPETTAAPDSGISATYTLPPDKLARAEHLDRDRNLISIGSAVWGILALWLILTMGWAAAIRNWAASLTPRVWLQGFFFLPALLLLLVAADLPFAIAGHHLSLTYGLSIQPWGSWLWDWTKSLLLSIAGGTIGLALLFAIVRRSPRRWWLWFWLISLPLEVLLIFILPVVVDPIFNRFEPLQKSNPQLVEQLERVVARSHLVIPPSRMFLMKASEKLTGLNAYVTGFGGSKRVVVWDTTIQQAPTDEILYIFGHEQGHYVLNHIRNGLLFSSVGTLAALLIGFWSAHWLLRRYGSRWKIPALEDWAAVAVLMLIFSVLSFFGEPVGNAFSRMQEHQADVYGQEVVHGIVPDPRLTATRSFQRLGEVWLEDPHPNPFLEFWFDSHPSTADRKAFAASYDPWQPGRTPRYFPKDSPR